MRSKLRLVFVLILFVSAMPAWAQTHGYGEWASSSIRAGPGKAAGTIGGGLECPKAACRRRRFPATRKHVKSVCPAFPE